ncbi:excisionase family DNA binding protein [Kibdelosporangium banguiense]|uniref:Excisionase family DNA binding protein n=1 Tax=Kibdelosporangium banguiense TaxID=1365924 RepID=A0ABS4TAE0_9PSEU|nr:helix-turn-helix domain-containing protein [Kibdelosporangium banguiense]MBP2321390.1 excisionase family DNA binding protein [Kibdelosporangium banguiense]
MSDEDIPAATRLLARAILAELGHLLTAIREVRAEVHDRPQRRREAAAQTWAQRNQEVVVKEAPTKTTTADPKSVNTKRAAEMLGIPRNSVSRLIRIGELSAIKLGRYRVIPIEEIDRILAQAQRRTA